MNTIILIILTLIFLVLAIFGIFLLKNMFMGSSSGTLVFIIGIFGLFYLGTTLIGDSGFVKETICLYTVGKSDEVCVDNYNYDFSHQIITTSVKIGFGYFIINIILIILFIKEIFSMLWHMGDCIHRRY